MDSSFLDVIFFVDCLYCLVNLYGSSMFVSYTSQYLGLSFRFNPRHSLFCFFQLHKKISTDWFQKFALRRASSSYFFLFFPIFLSILLIFLFFSNFLLFFLFFSHFTFFRPLRFSNINIFHTQYLFPCKSNLLYMAYGG